MTKKESNTIPPDLKKKPPALPALPEKRIIKEDVWGNTKKEKTIIELEEDEIAFVMNSKEDVQLYLPKMDDGDSVPEYVQFVSAMMIVCTTDEEVIELIWEKFYDLADKEKVN